MALLQFFGDSDSERMSKIGQYIMR